MLGRMSGGVFRFSLKWNRLARQLTTYPCGADPRPGRRNPVPQTDHTVDDAGFISESAFWSFGRLRGAGFSPQRRLQPSFRLMLSQNHKVNFRRDITVSSRSIHG